MNYEECLQFASGAKNKDDAGKTRYDLIPPLALQALAEVYGYGVKKYSARGWEQGIPWTKWFAALMRHAWDWMRGEDLDPESGLPHMAHAAWNCMALLEYYLRKRGIDDRPYSNNTVAGLNDPVGP